MVPLYQVTTMPLLRQLLWNSCMLQARRGMIAYISYVQ